MGSLREFQARFLEALHGDGTAPELLPDPARLDIYRNNMFGCRREALRAAYPVVERLVGAEFFRHAANRFARAYPSRSGDLGDYGTEFADFLAGFPGAASLAYLPDTARLEWRLHEASRAADRAPLALDRLARVPPSLLGALVLVMHPACRLLASPYPVHRIWQANQPGEDGVVDLAEGGVRLLVRRRADEVTMAPLGAGEFAMLEELAAYRSFAHAYARAEEAEPGFDVADFLARHGTGGTWADFGIGGADLFGCA